MMVCRTVVDGSSSVLLHLHLRHCRPRGRRCCPCRVCRKLTGSTCRLCTVLEWVQRWWYFRPILWEWTRPPPFTLSTPLHSHYVAPTNPFTSKTNEIWLPVLSHITPLHFSVAFVDSMLAVIYTFSHSQINPHLPPPSCLHQLTQTHTQSFLSCGLLPSTRLEENRCYSTTTF